jgi:hypothetical protein
MRQKLGPMKYEKSLGACKSTTRVCLCFDAEFAKGGLYSSIARESGVLLGFYVSHDLECDRVLSRLSFWRILSSIPPMSGCHSYRSFEKPTLQPERQILYDVNCGQEEIQEMFPAPCTSYPKLQGEKMSKAHLFILRIKSSDHSTY